MPPPGRADNGVVGGIVEHSHCRVNHAHAASLAAPGRCRPASVDGHAINASAL